MGRRCSAILDTGCCRSASGHKVQRPTVAPDADGLKQDTGERLGYKGGACVKIQTNLGKSEVENRLGRLVTGWLRRHRGLERGPKIISAGLRYATRERLKRAIARAHQVLPYDYWDFTA